MIQQKSMNFAITLFAATLLVPALVSANEPKGQALLVVYPDYPVGTDFLDGELGFVGHAGVLLISETGLTKYYEFGRYEGKKDGVIKNRRISNVEMKDGLPTEGSLAKVLGELSHESGKDGRIRAARFLGMDFEAMHEFAKQGRFEKYSAAKANCGHFAEAVILRGNPKVDRPLVIDFTPNNLVDEYIEEGNAAITFNPENRAIRIEKGDESDAKVQDK